MNAATVQVPLGHTTPEQVQSQVGQALLVLAAMGPQAARWYLAAVVS